MKLIKITIILLLVCQTLEAQFLNKEIRAVLEIENTEDVYNIKAKAENISDINRSVIYELKVLTEGLKSKNKNITKQSGRFVIASKEVLELSKTAIGLEDNQKIIVLLLIKNLDQIVIGRDRKIITATNVSDQQYDKQVNLTKRKPADGIKLKGVVLERVRTKPGRDFYNFFYSKYLTYNFNDSRPILIEEVHDRGRTTKITLKIDNRKVYEFFVQPNFDYLKRQSDMAIRLVYQFFEKKEDDYIVRY